jgi:peptidoglycan-associated lipoprotein
VTHETVSFASFSFARRRDNDAVTQDRSEEEAAMKLFSAMVVPIIIVVLATSSASPLNASPREQGQSAATPDQANMLIWKDPDVIQDLKDVLFDFDTHESASEHTILVANAQWLKDHPNVRFKIAAFTDPRGDIFYNLVLSQKRADTVKRELIQMGVAENQIVYATGWGELYPNCLEPTEECWGKSRRAEFVRASD